MAPTESSQHRSRLSYQYAKDYAGDDERKEDAACCRDKESECKGSEREHMTGNRRHEGNPDRKCQENSIGDRVHAGPKHDPRQNTGKADIADVLQERNCGRRQAIGRRQAKQHPEPEEASQVATTLTTTGIT